MHRTQQILDLLDLWPVIGALGFAIALGLYGFSLRIRWYFYARRTAQSPSARPLRRFTAHARMTSWVAWPAFALVLSIFVSIVITKGILFKEYARFRSLAQDPNVEFSLWSRIGPIEPFNLAQVATFKTLLLSGVALPGGRNIQTPSVEPIVGICFHGRDEVYSLGRGDYYPNEFRLMLGYQPGSTHGHVVRRFSSSDLDKWLKNHAL
jgi:hypothetical protein